MLKYFCDICGQEIKETFKRLKAVNQVDDRSRQA